MKLKQYFLTSLILVCACLIALPNAHAEIVEGKHYKKLDNPQPTEDASKIEVLEFFWYGCPHCYSLHPHLKTWLENLPDDVNFRYVPANLRASWIVAAKIFYTIEAMGKTAILHDSIYDAIHRDKIDLHQESVLFDWIEKQGVDRKKFENTFNSFSVQNQVARATQMARQLQLNGVPALIIDGKYLTSGGMSSTPQGTIDTLNALLEKVRNER